MKKIKGIIFDKDGTLFDIQRSWSEWAKVFVTKFSKKHDLDIIKLSKLYGICQFSCLSESLEALISLL